MAGRWMFTAVRAACRTCTQSISTSTAASTASSPLTAVIGRKTTAAATGRRAVSWAGCAGAPQNHHQQLQRRHHSTDKMLVVTNGFGDTSVPESAKKEVLQDLVHGPYTTARTVNKRNLVEFPMHVERIHAVVSKLHEQSGGVAFAGLDSVEACKQHLQAAIVEALDMFEHHYPETCQDDTERRVTVVLSTNDLATPAFNTKVLVETLPAPPKHPVLVKIRQRPPGLREEKALKSLQWMRSRKTLEEEQGDAHELLLCTAGGEMFEGLQTNCYGVIDGQVYTSFLPEVLPGTIRMRVMEACGTLGIGVRREGPNVSCFDDWTGAFITSTSRLVVPIGFVQLHRSVAGDRPCQEGSDYTAPIELPVDDTIHSIADFVQQRLLQNSTPMVTQAQ
eukprot:m.76677 g.76677  ORF g.76677 m.76677 type:complete len:392 (+) comp14519_c0_seq4:160-1335(+)